MSEFVRRDKWKEFLNDFTKRNQFRTTRLEVVGEIGDQDLIGPDGLEEGLGFEDADGTRTILLFEKLPQIPEKTSDNRITDSRSAHR